MYYLRPANQRGETHTDWLDSRHTFSFGSYYDPKFMGFSDLRVINDDTLKAGGGFDTHPHDNMEIISVVLSGQLAHKDNLGNNATLSPGEIQRISAGSGIIHSAFNPSLSTETRLLQIWILPNVSDITPSYEHKKFEKLVMTNNLTLIVSPDGRDNSLSIHQDAEIYQTYLEKNTEVTFNIDHKRVAWVQIARGSVVVNSQILVSGDGFAIFDVDEIVTIRGVDDLSNLLVFNLKS